MCTTESATLIEKLPCRYGRAVSSPFRILSRWPTWGRRFHSCCLLSECQATEQKAWTHHDWIQMTTVHQQGSQPVISRGCCRRSQMVLQMGAEGGAGGVDMSHTVWIHQAVGSGQNKQCRVHRSVWRQSPCEHSMWKCQGDLHMCPLPPSLG